MEHRAAGEHPHIGLTYHVSRFYGVLNVCSRKSDPRASRGFHFRHSSPVLSVLGKLGLGILYSYFIPGFPFHRWGLTLPITTN